MRFAAAATAGSLKIVRSAARSRSMLSTVAIAPALATTPARINPTPQEGAPIIDALQHYAASRTIPFSTPGHKRGAALDGDLRELLGSQFGGADVWLNTADHDRCLRQA